MSSGLSRLPEASDTLSVIKLRVLGEVDLRGPDDSPLRSILSGSKRLAVLAYLALQTPRFQRRDTLIGLFWPDQDQDHARGSLRNMVHVLRRGLGENVLVSRGDEELGVDLARLWCDALAFEAALKEGRPAESLELYRGELLAGLNVSAAPEFERWLEEERERLRHLAARGAWREAERQAGLGNVPGATDWGRRAVQFSPYDEEGMRRLLTMLERFGDRAGAVAAYEEFRRRLRKDLELEPSVETQLVLRRLRRTPFVPPLDPEANRTVAEQRSKVEQAAGRPAGQRAPGPKASLATAGAEGRIIAHESRLPDNIPIPPTALLGRAEELKKIRSIVCDAQARLVTLTGAPGTGKTRLALQTARDMAGHFRNGVAAVFLASVTDDERVASAVAHTLGLSDHAPGPVLERLQEYLRPLEAMIVLDNFEQVLEASSIVSQLLAGCPGITFIVTSRAALQIRGEWEFVVPPLETPTPDDEPNPERLSAYSAVRLFVERAQAVRASFAMDEGNARAVAEICRRMDGLPLALELAAAQVKMLPPKLILERLKSRLGFLREGPRDLPAHQRTIRAAIDWSYNLLSPAEQRLFRQLGVFVEGFTLEAAEAVAPQASELTDNLTSLLDKSLVGRADQGDAEPRYSMLATIRQYAFERLMDEGEMADAQRRHAEFYGALAERANPALKTRDQVEWLQRLESEHDNLRAALGWGLRHDSHLAARIACGLSRFWSARGHLTEGREWLERVVKHVGAIPPALQVRTLNSAGVLANSQADYARAVELWEHALALGRMIGDASEIRRSLTNLAAAYVQRGVADRATELLEEALANCGDEKAARASILGNLGYVRYVQGDSQSGRALWESCLQLNREIGDTTNTLMALNNLTWSLLIEDDADSAEELVEEALELSRQLGISTAGCQVLENMAWIAEVRGQNERAVSLNKDALRMALRSGGPRQFLSIIQSLGALALKMGQLERAAHLYAVSSGITAEHEFYGSTLLDKHRVEGNIADLRTRMGEAAFERAWGEGAAMSLDDALAFALG